MSEETIAAFNGARAGDLWRRACQLQLEVDILKAEKVELVEALRDLVPILREAGLPTVAEVVERIAARVEEQ